MDLRNFAVVSGIVGAVALSTPPAIDQFGVLDAAAQSGGGAGAGGSGAGGGPGGGAGNGPGNGAGNGPGNGTGNGTGQGVANGLGKGLGVSGNGVGASSGHGAVTSAVATSDDTTGLDKAQAVVGTTPASDQASESIQSNIDRRDGDSEDDEDGDGVEVVEIDVDGDGGKDGALTSSVAASDDTTGVGKAQTVVGTTDASDEADESIQSAIDRRDAEEASAEASAGISVD